MPAEGIRAKLFRVSLQPIAWLLKTGDEHATIDRLLGSKHVRDLQLIISISCAAVFLIGCLGAGIFVVKLEGLRHVAPADRIGHLYDTVVKCLKYGGPVLIVFGGIIRWAYQTGSSRLGVVDLFACEISTLCRVTKVVETVRLCVYRVGHPPELHSNGEKSHLHETQQFTSEEDYFPVFAANNQELQELEANVVINITAFYTYMKAFRDSLRSLAQLGPAIAEANDQLTLEAWQTATGNSVYMLFLGLESARHAIYDLVEFEPEQAERMIVVLLSELEAFQFLRGKYSKRKEDDIYRRRIELRVPEYEQRVPPLIELVKRKAKPPQTSNWTPSYLLLDELESLYSDAISAFPKGGSGEHRLVVGA